MFLLHTDICQTTISQCQYIIVYIVYIVSVYYYVIIIHQTLVMLGPYIYIYVYSFNPFTAKLDQVNFNPYRAGTDFSRQNLTSRRQILTTKVDPRAVRVEIFLVAVDT